MHFLDTNTLWNSMPKRFPSTNIPRTFKRLFQSLSKSHKTPRAIRFSELNWLRHQQSTGPFCFESTHQGFLGVFGYPGIQFGPIQVESVLYALSILFILSRLSFVCVVNWTQGDSITYNVKPHNLGCTLGANTTESPEFEYVTATLYLMLRSGCIIPQTVQVPQLVSCDNRLSLSLIRGYRYL